MPDLPHATYVQHDRLGSVTQVTDTAGNLTGTVGYDPWGVPTGDLALANYTGHDYDAVLEVYFAQARVYAAKDRRFLAVDIIAGTAVMPGTLNRYDYCRSNPMVFVDPDGRAEIIVNGKAVEYYMNGSDIYVNVLQMFAACAINYDTSLQAYQGYFDNGDTLRFRINQNTITVERYLTSELQAGISSPALTASVPWEAMDSGYYVKLGCVEDYLYLGEQVGYKIENGKIKYSADFLHISPKLFEFVKSYEAFRAKPYYASDRERQKGILTIGYGHQILPTENLTEITEPVAAAMLWKELDTYYADSSLRPFLQKEKIFLTQYEFDALISFTYNVGEFHWNEKLVKDFPLRDVILEGKNSGKYDTEKLRAAFTKHSYAGKFEPDLWRRRMDEFEMFLYGDYVRNDTRAVP